MFSNNKTSKKKNNFNRSKQVEFCHNNSKKNNKNNFVTNFLIKKTRPVWTRKLESQSPLLSLPSMIRIREEKLVHTTTQILAHCFIFNLGNKAGFYCGIDIMEKITSWLMLLLLMVPLVRGQFFFGDEKEEATTKDPLACKTPGN